MTVAAVADSARCDGCSCCREEQNKGRCDGFNCVRERSEVDS